MSMSMNVKIIKLKMIYRKNCKCLFDIQKKNKRKKLVEIKWAFHSTHSSIIVVGV